MFEEVPRPRRGIAGWSTRRIVLGPFAVGGGVLLATVGGSVAVAATVFTATTIVASDVPPRQLPQPVVVSSSGHPTHPSTVATRPDARTTPPAVASTAAPDRLPSGPLTVAERQRTETVSISVSASPTSSAPASGSASVTASPSGTPSSSPSGPAGNAVVFIDGYDQASQRLLFEFATVTSGAGPGGSDQYAVTSSQQFDASIAGDITITSGGQLCPPAGSSCTVGQLIAGSQAGFFANVAIDATAAMHSVIELDNASSAPQTSPSASPSASAARSGIAQPTVSSTDPTPSPSDQ